MLTFMPGLQAESSPRHLRSTVCSSPDPGVRGAAGGRPAHTASISEELERDVLEGAGGAVVQLIDRKPGLIGSRIWRHLEKRSCFCTSARPRSEVSP